MFNQKMLAKSWYKNGDSCNVGKCWKISENVGNCCKILKLVETVGK